MICQLKKVVKMKFNIIILALVSLATISCTDLNENLFSQVDSDEYGKTPQEVETIVGGAYSSLHGLKDNLYNEIMGSAVYRIFKDSCSLLKG